MDDGPRLKRSLSLPLLTFYGLGTVLGAGIYALIGKVVGRAGMLAPLAFLGASILALFTALAYAELSSRLPRSAGEAVYVDSAFRRPWLSVTVGLMVVLTGVVSAAAIANAFVGYLAVFIDLPDWLVITVLVIALGMLAAWGIVESITAAMVITLIEIAGLLLVVWVARDGLASLPERAGELVPSFRAADWSGLWLGAFLAFYAFIGFEDMVNVVEEVKDPPRVMPRAILLVLGLSTGLYVLVALAAVLAVPTADLAAADAPLAMIFERTTGSRPTLITIISLFAVTNGSLVQIIMGSRILYGLSDRGWIPRVFGRVHPSTRTPIIATGVITAVVLVLAVWFPLLGLAEATTFIMLLVFALVNASLIRLKHTDPHPAGVRAYPRWIPITGLTVCLAFILFRALGMAGVL